MRADQGYEYFEHTADVGMRAAGRSLDELFIHAARGMVGLLLDSPPTGTDESHPIQLLEESPEDLLHRWLKELLFWFHTDKFLPTAYHIQVLEQPPAHWTVRGWLDGERFDPARHAPGTEIKGVTYHQFRVASVGSAWEAEVIFDV